MFRHLNLEKPTKWFLNLASDQKDAESPTNKKKYCDKYKNTPEWERKYEKKEEVHEDMFNHFKNIFDKREREKGDTISKFLGEIENHPEALAKKLTKAKKEANEKEISLDELKETLEDDSGKTPGIDGVDKDFLLRFWNLIGPTIHHAQKTFIQNEELNEFLDTGLFKVLKKGGTKMNLSKIGDQSRY